MPVIKAMPALEVIRGFKGTLDFYYWRGLPCVRKWPHTPRAHLTQGTLDASAIFTAIIQAYGLLGSAVKSLYQEAAADQPRTGRDLYVTGTYGHLHESSMSEITDLITIANGYLLTLIELTNALQSNAADRLLVRGEDQLFSLDAIVSSYKAYTATYSNYHIYSDPVPAGKYWIISTITVVNNTRAIPSYYLSNRHNGISNRFHTDTTSHAQYIPAEWQGVMHLDAGDQLDAEIRGSASGDGLVLRYFGYQMSLEI